MNIELKQLIKQKFAEVEKAQIELKQLVNEHLPDNGMFHVVSDFWDCPDSPFGLCSYHNIEDPAHDSCVFCGEPFERK